MKIGYFKHWFQPPYSFITFLKEKLGIEVQEIEFRKPNYLEGFDVAIIEQNGFNDFIENDEMYFREFVQNGGICWFMHQDYRRWAKYFLPEGIGYPTLTYRYVSTINEGSKTFKCYMMPFIEDAGYRLFNEPNQICPEDMIYWRVPANTFGVVGTENNMPPEIIKSAALSCATDCAGWEILGSYMDPVVSDGALVLQARYGKGLYFWNQILFPETADAEDRRPFQFWEKYVPNVLEHFRQFKAGDTSPAVKPQKKPMALKRNYKTAIHLHSLEWYGGDNSVGTIAAMMRYMDFDIATIAVKDAIPYHGNLDLGKFSDDKILMLHGQEYHPFNWTEVNAFSCHNAYHMLAMGIDADAYTPEFTRSLFSTPEVKEYLVKAIDYVHEHGGAVCATHPYFDYWKDYKYDAVDKEGLCSIENSDFERFYANGGHIAFMNSVDLFGAERLLTNPAANFIYIDGVPTRDALVNAIKKGHCIAALFMKEVDVTLGDALPGDTVTAMQNPVLKVHAVADSGNIRQLRLYSGGEKVAQYDYDTAALDVKIAVNGLPLKTYLRVEIEGERENIIAISTPFYL